MLYSELAKYVQNIYTVYEYKHPLPEFNSLCFVFRHYGNLYQLNITLNDNDLVYRVWEIDYDKFDNVCYRSVYDNTDLIKKVTPKIDSKRLDILRMQSLL